MITKFKITNVTCDACLKLSKVALNSLPGVKKIEIDKDGVTALETEQTVSFADIKEALEKVDKKISLIS